MLTHFTPTASRTPALMIALTGLVLMSGCGASFPMSSAGTPEEIDQIANEFEDPASLVEESVPVATIKPAVAPPAYKPATQAYVETDEAQAYSDRIANEFEDGTEVVDSAGSVTPGKPVEVRVHQADEPREARDESGDE